MKETSHHCASRAQYSQGTRSGSTKEEVPPAGGFCLYAQGLMSRYSPSISRLFSFLPLGLSLLEVSFYLLYA